MVHRLGSLRRSSSSSFRDFRAWVTLAGFLIFWLFTNKNISNFGLFGLCQDNLMRGQAGGKTSFLGPWLLANFLSTTAWQQ